MRNCDRINMKIKKNNENIMEIINPKTGDTYFHSLLAAGLEAIRNYCERTSFDRNVLEVSNNLKQRPLHIAVATLDVPLVEYLLIKGASVDAFKKGDWTSLMITSTFKKIKAVEIVKILLQYGANPNLKNKDGWTAMHIACKTGNIEIVTELFNVNPTLINIPSKNGRITLHIAALNAHSDLTRKLIELGGSNLCETRDCCGSTPAMDAVVSGCIKTVEIIARHVDLTTHVDTWGLTCLHKAAQLGYTEIIRYLVAKGLRVNDETRSEGYTPLRYALSEKHYDTVSVLIALGADTTLCDK